MGSKKRRIVLNLLEDEVIAEETPVGHIMETGHQFEEEEQKEEVEMDEEEDASEDTSKKGKKDKEKGKGKGGVVYLSYIPQGMNPRIVREKMAQLGDVGRIFLEPNKGSGKGSRKKKVNGFLEGWVEFRRKRVAKQVALRLNGAPVGGKRRTAYHDTLWSVRYLHRFKWSHLAETMNYEKALREQRVRFEVGMAQKETDFYMDRVDELKKREKFRAKGENQEVSEEGMESRSVHYKRKQRITDEEIRRRQEEEEGARGVDMDLLQRIFA